MKKEYKFYKRRTDESFGQARHGYVVEAENEKEAIKKFRKKMPELKNSYFLWDKLSLPTFGDFINAE